MEQSNIPSAQNLVLQCKVFGIKNIVISPGSRNAPLTLSFTEDSFFKCYSIVDERCAAFFAMGMAQQLRAPVVALCTSGSALLNYYPAVAEAFYSDIPLVLISADRPSYKIDVGDGQTIRQDFVFERHIGYSANLKQDVSHAADLVREYAPELMEHPSIKIAQEKVNNFNSEEIKKAIGLASNNATPVHINIPFEEPLYETVSIEATIPKPLKSKDYFKKEIDLGAFSTIWNSTKRKMILVGTNPPNDIEQQFLDKLAHDDSVIFLTETTSNLHHNNFFTSIDSLIAPIEKSENRQVLFNALKPDVLLTFGGLIVSKKIKAFLRNNKPKHHWHVNVKQANNTFFCLSQHFKIHPNDFFKKFTKEIIPVESDYFKFWNSKRDYYQLKREAYLGTIPFSDMVAFKNILKHIPNDYQLQLSNSSTVRYAQLFNLNKTLRVFCNRGTSGIDGSVSTAVGASLVNEGPTLLVTGDLSFLYDSNALWNNYLRSDFRIIVVNNSGGGIFRILPGHRETTNFKTFFETPQTLEISHLGKLFGFEFMKADNDQELERILETFYEFSEKPRLLEVKTPNLLNNKILLDYFDFIS